MKPNKVNILGIEYKITYCDKPSDVDIYEHHSLWGQIDLWSRTIRIYDNGRPIADIWQTMLHEIIHGIAAQLHIKGLECDSETDEDAVDTLALALLDVFMRNGWLKP
jgi:hypothetical protein